MNILHDLRKQPFLLTVSIFAFIHSAWTFGTMFGGLEPKPYHSGDWWAWWIPGAFMAFSIDIGILSIAKRIREGERQWSTIAVFIILAISMCYAQFVFMGLHMPSVPMAPGVRREWVDFVQFCLDATLFVFPSLLPIALILYAFVEKHAKLQAENVRSNAKLATLEHPILIEKPDPKEPMREIENEGQKQPFLTFSINGHEKVDVIE
jgi:hypothetical protein